MFKLPSICRKLLKKKHHKDDDDDDKRHGGDDDDDVLDDVREDLAGIQGSDTLQVTSATSATTTTTVILDAAYFEAMRRNQLNKEAKQLDKLQRIAYEAMQIFPNKLNP